MPNERSNRARQPRFDAVDEQLVALLRTNGRRSNTELARQLGLTEGAVRKKLKKLTSEGVVMVVAVADPQKLGYHIDVFIGAQISPQSLTWSVAEKLGALEPVRYIALSTGSYDILFEAMFRHQDELLEFVTKTLPAIPGIVRTETWHLLKVTKRNYDWLNMLNESADAGMPAAQQT